MKSALRLLALMAPSLVCSPAWSQAKEPVGCAPQPAMKAVVNVRETGAKGDGQTNDTAAIQRAIDATAGTGGTVLVPAGIYMVDAVHQRLQLKSRMNLKLAQGATLKVLPNAAQSYALLTLSGVSDIHISGGTLEGDRELHQAKTGEWGMGISLINGAHTISISNVTARKMWGDGFFIEGARRVALCSVVADANRRQGLSIIDAQNVLVTDSVFSNTRGTRPSAGIDLEPYKPEHAITDVRILRSKFVDNLGPGILISGSKEAHNISNVEITGNHFRNLPPVKIKYAPAVLDSMICKNRYTVRREEAGGDLSTVGSAPREVTLQAACGDPGLRTRQ